MEKIQQITGDLSVISGFHDFRNAKFLLPTICNLCKKSIWGLSKHGYSCTRCNYFCHLKCKQKVAPSCTNEKTVNDHANYESVDGTFSAVLDSLSSIEVKDIDSPEETYHKEHHFSNGDILQVLGDDSRTVSPASDEFLFRVEACYPFDAQGQDELTITEGDIINVISIDCPDGWWFGGLNGRMGLFPLNYVEKI